MRIAGRIVGFTLLALSLCAADEPILTTMHGVIRSKGEYVLGLSPDRMTGTVYSGHPAIVTRVRNASRDPLHYCVALDAGQTPEFNSQMRQTAGDLIKAIARPGERGRAVVFTKSMKSAAVTDWNPNPAALAAFVQEPRDAKGSDPFSALVECADKLDEGDPREPQIRAIFLIAGRPTESSRWITDWFIQRMVRSDIQLYIVSFDPGLITGGQEKRSEPIPRRRRIYQPLPVTPTIPAGWYAPTLFRVARDSAGDVIQVFPNKAVDVSVFAGRLRHQVEITVESAAKDTNSYRSFKLTAPEVDVQVATVLYVPKRK